MKYYLIAGEASGDLHGSNLMKALKREDPSAEFRFLGGDLMKAEGGALVKHYADMSYMGFLEVVKNLPAILRNLEHARHDLLEYKPDALILVDFPGFNLKMADFASKQGIPVYYYISPKVWAWNQKRVLKIKKVVTRLFCILPFEVEFFRSWGMEVDYVGNPLLDAIKSFKPDEQFRQKNKLDDRPVVALLPGSRKQEIEKIFPEMLATATRFPFFQFVIAGAPGFPLSYYQSFFKAEELTVVFNSTYDLLRHSTAAIVTSGTATLETALFKVPQVVVYKTSPVSVAIARMVIKVKYISLVNLIMNREVVKELIQKDCNVDAIGEELARLLKGSRREEMLKDYQLLDQRMGDAGASDRTARLIVESLSGYSKQPS